VLALRLGIEDFWEWLSSNEISEIKNKGSLATGRKVATINSQNRNNKK
jgi:hypothetical protein